jgi:hypothetical protein
MRIGTRLLALAAGLLLALPALAADVAGKWTSEFDSQIGKQKYTFDLKVDGGKVTGKAHYERMGQAGDVDLQDGKLAGDEISFVEVGSFQGNELRIQYTGKVKGDEIAFTRDVGGFVKEEIVARRAKD